MRRVLPMLVIMLVGFAPVPPYRPKPDPVRNDLKEMQGVWDLVSRTSCGRPVEHIVETVTISGDHLTYMNATGSFRGTWTLKLSSDQSLRKFDAKTECSPHELGMLLGVYKICGDTLSMCYVNADSGLLRPTDLTTQQEWVYLDVLRRRKPKP